MLRATTLVCLLKRHNKAKIINKSVFLFWLLDKSITCQHVHRLELRTFFKFCVANLTVKHEIRTKFNVGHAYPKKEIWE